MRVLIWSGGYPPDPGGVEVVVQDLARDLAARGHALVIVAQSAGEQEVAEHRPEGLLHRLPFHQALSSRDPARVFDLTRRVAGIRRRFAPDLVHAHAVHPSHYFLLRTSGVSPCPVVFTLHGWTPMASGQETLRTRMLRHADRVTGCSQHVVDRIVHEAPEVAARTVTIHNGCRDPGIATSSLPFDPPRLLSAGRLVESKGVDDVLRVLPAVRRRVPGTCLTVVGDGPCRASLETECARLGLAGCTEFTGALARHEVFARMNAATALVVPSRGGSEGLPLVALEAALMARPVVATRDGGLPEAVVDGRTGFLVESGDHAGLERAIVRVLRDPTLAASLGRSGRQHVRDAFDWDAQAARYAWLYDEVTGGRRT